MVPLDDVPDGLFMSELVVLEPVLLPLRVVLLLMPEDEVDGVVIVFASVERPVLGVVLPLDMLPVLGAVVLLPLDMLLPLLVELPDDVVPAVPGVVVPVGDAVDDDGLVLVVPDEVLPEEVWACARLTAPTRAAIEAAAVKVLENFMRGLLFERLRKDVCLAATRRTGLSRPGTSNGN